jgi:hypothetical protein
MEEQIERNNEPNNNLIYVNRNTLRLKLFKILNYINGSLINSPPDRAKLKYFFDYLPFYSRYRDEDDNEKNIFSEIIQGGNNLFLYCCIHKLSPVCEFIVTNFGNLFNIGEKNHKYQTALIICIKNNMFDVAREILDHSEGDDEDDDIANLGQIDKDGKTAMDYMLQKVKVNEDGKPLPLNENKEIVDNIEIIVDLLYFYLNETNNNTLMDRNIYLNSENDSLHNYIDLICQDLDFWKPLLEGYFDGDTRIQFNEKSCFNVKEAEINMKPIIPQNRNIRSNRLPPNLPIAIPTHSNPIIRQTRNPNQPLQIQQYQLNPKNTQIPAPLPEYDVNNPGTIITYPAPSISSTPPTPTTQDNKKRKRQNQEDDDEPSSNTSTNNKKSNIGGYKRKKTNKKRFQNRKSKKLTNIKRNNKNKKSISKRNKKPHK